MADMYNLKINKIIQIITVKLNGETIVLTEVIVIKY